MMTYLCTAGSRLPLLCRRTSQWGTSPPRPRPVRCRFSRRQVVVTGCSGRQGGRGYGPGDPGAPNESMTRQFLRGASVSGCYRTLPAKVAARSDGDGAEGGGGHDGSGGGTDSDWRLSAGRTPRVAGGHHQQRRRPVLVALLRLRQVSTDCQVRHCRAVLCRNVVACAPLECRVACLSEYTWLRAVLPHPLPLRAAHHSALGARVWQLGSARAPLFVPARRDSQRLLSPSDYVISE